MSDSKRFSFLQIFLSNINNETDSEGLTKFNLRVDGSNTFLAEDDGQVPNAYKNLISAYMPFYQFDINGMVKLKTPLKP